jgi:hypothetical protein
MLGAFSPATMRAVSGPLRRYPQPRSGHPHILLDRSDKSAHPTVTNKTGSCSQPADTEVMYTLPVWIGNNGGVNWQFNAGYGSCGAYPALAKSATADQLELGGST